MRGTHVVIVIFATLLCGCSTNQNQTDNISESIVLAHELGRDGTSERKITQRFEQEGYKACPLQYSTLAKSLSSLIDTTNQQIDDCITKASTGHFMGHSFGGLIIRSYLANNEKFTFSKSLEM